MNTRTGKHTSRLSMLLAAIVMGAVLPLRAPAISVQAADPITLGAIYPLHLGAPPVQEYDGLRTAIEMVNDSGGVRGRQVRLDLTVPARREDAPAAVSKLVSDHVTAIVGSSESLIALPASAAAQAAGYIYWESGAVATMLTVPGHPDVFRTVTTGETLGRSAAYFAARVIAPRLHLAVRKMRVAIVAVRDVYGLSVSAAQAAETKRMGMQLVSYQKYTYRPNMSFTAIVHTLIKVHPNVVLVAAYLQDGIAFRRETIRQHFRVGAMIGTSSSFCMSAFANALGRGAVGLFAADKPDVNINPNALTPAANRLRLKANSMYRRLYGADMSGPAVAGFVAGWVLLHNVLPNAPSLTPAAIRQAALRVNLPAGSEINGAGVRFAPPGLPDEGQNLRATSVVWQWQRPGHARVVYPAVYATGTPHFIPLPPEL